MTETAEDPKTLSEVIADFVTGFDLDAAPEALTTIAETAFADTVGVMLAGSREPAARKVTAMIAAEGAAPAASVVGHGLRSSAQNAALANGTAVQALDFDHTFMMGQATAALIPGLLPLAETIDAAPRDMIAAYIIGSEVCAALARCFPTLSREGGWQGAGVLGTLSSAAAFAALTHQPAALIPGIIGISTSMASSISTNLGTMTKPLHAGLAARNGIAAMTLGADGLTANPVALEGPNGFFACYAKGLEWNTHGFDTLGHEFALLDPGYLIKPFACGGLLHCGIEAALHLRAGLRKEEKRAIDGISRIIIGVSHHTLNRALDRYPWSEDSARFSFRYLVAYALIHGAPRGEAFTVAGYGDDAVRALADRAEMVLDDEIASMTFPGYSPGRVTLEMADGSRREHAVFEPTGTRNNPMSEAKLREKFDACAPPVVGADQAAELYATLTTLSGRDSLKGLWPLIAVSE